MIFCYRINSTWSAALDVFNTLNQEVNDIDHYYAWWLKTNPLDPMTAAPTTSKATPPNPAPSA